MGRTRRGSGRSGNGGAFVRRGFVEELVGVGVDNSGGIFRVAITTARPRGAFFVEDGDNTVTKLSKAVDLTHLVSEMAIGLIMGDVASVLGSLPNGDDGATKKSDGDVRSVGSGTARDLVGHLNGEKIGFGKVF